MKITDVFGLKHKAMFRTDFFSLNCSHTQGTHSSAGVMFTSPPLFSDSYLTL
jgi:hypothetical protein